MSYSGFSSGQSKTPEIDVIGQRSVTKSLPVFGVGKKKKNAVFETV
jgi:hypothetical protein